MNIENITIKYFNDVYAKVICSSPSVAMELSEYFTFVVPNAKFTPAFRNKVWDGKIRLYNKMNCNLYCGLIPYVYKFAKERNYKLVLDKNYPLPSVKFKNDTEVQDYINNLKICNQNEELLNPLSHQIEGFKHAINNERCLLLSPTASGKSHIIYSLCRYFVENNEKSTLIIVPTVSLVYQLFQDFKTYSKISKFDVEKMCNCVHSGKDKVNNKKITISTWQSVYKMPAGYFEKFDAVIVDESHHMKSNSIKNIMEKLITCKYKIGLTGTLDGMQTSKLVVEGLTGLVKRIATTKDLIDQNILSNLKINCNVLSYNQQDRDTIKKFTYHEEIAYLVNHEHRTRYICELALSQNSNTLILYQFVEKHGKKIYETLQKLNKDKNRKIYFISGDVDGDTRENARQEIEKEKNAIIVASYGTFSTGINIRSLTNIVFASPAKGRIRVLQSIGRQLRKNLNKELAVLHDISDDLSTKSKQNYSLKHLLERIKIYNDEKFDYSVKKIEVNYEQS